MNVNTTYSSDNFELQLIFPCIKLVAIEHGDPSSTWYLYLALRETTFKVNRCNLENQQRHKGTIPIQLYPGVREVEKKSFGFQVTSFLHYMRSD